jgi:aspartyl-tRNA synthetase
MQAEPGDLLLFVADTFEVTCKALHGLRKRLGAELKLYDPAGDALFVGRRVPDVRLGRGGAPLGGDAPSVHRAARRTCELLETTRASAARKAYDLVINGYEAGGGTIRIHDPQIQQQVFGCWASTRATARSGSASCSTRCNTARRRTAASRWASTAGDALRRLDNIRDCIAFPKTQRATDLMTGALEPRQLKELGVKLESVSPVRLVRDFRALVV